MSTSMTSPGGKRPAPSSTDTPPRDKRLKTIACDRCRRRKVKCDGDGYNQTPCKYCVSVNLDCTYGQKTTRTNSQSSKANSTPRQTGRNPARSKSISTTTVNTDNVMSPSSSTSNLSMNTRRIVPQDLPTPDSKKNDYEYMVKLCTSTTLQNENQVRQLLKRYVQVPQVEESSSPRLQTNNALLDNVHFIGHLVDLYFKNFHPLLPVLHKVYFMDRFNDKNKQVPPLLLYAVCAIGSRYTNNRTARKDSNNPYTAGLAYYENAQDLAKHYFDLPHLSTATALFLLGMFDTLRSLRSRMYVGMATTLAVTMRFHDKNAFPETLSVNERDARKRLWWSIAIVNRLQCISLNRMLAFQDNCNIGDPDENCADDEERKITIYFRFYLMITDTIYEILKVNLGDNDFNTSSLEEKLITWKKPLPSYLNIEGTKKLDTPYNETTIEHLRIYLCILYNYAMIRIHHPHISSMSSSLKACTQAANNITSLLNEYFVEVINSEPNIIHCVLFAGFIHVFNLKEQQYSKDSKGYIASTIKFLQNILKIHSLRHIHYSIKNSIAIFASHLEGISDEDYITDIVRSSLVLISGSSGNSSSNESPVSPTTNEESRNINNNINNVSNIVQDNTSLGLKKPSPIQQSAQNSPPGINLLAHTAATRPPHYGPPVNHGPSGLQQSQQMSQQTQQQQQQNQSIFATAPTPLDPPVTSAKIDSTNPSLMPDYSPTQYIHQSRQHENNSTWQSNYSNYQQWPHQSNHLQPIQTQPHQNVQQQTTLSPTGQTMMVINNSPVTTSSSLRNMSMTSPNSSSLAPLLIATTNTTSTNTTYTSFPYQNSALPSMSYQLASQQQQQPQHSSQPYMAYNNTSPPSTIGISGNFVAGNEMSTPMTGMIGNSGGATNGMMSTSENSVSMLIDSDLEHHSHHQQHQQRRTSQQAQY